MGILDKALEIIGINRGVSENELTANNPNIKTFSDIDEGDEVLSNSVLMNNVYGKGATNSSQFQTIKGYKQAVYGQVSTDKIRRLAFFREMSVYPEVSDAIDEVCEACLNNDERDNIINLKFSTIAEKLPSEVKKEIEEHIEHFLSLFDFESKGFDYFKRLVTDGEMTFENIIDDTNEDLGIIGVNHIRSETYEYLIDDNFRHHGIVINGKLLTGVGNEDIPQHQFNRNKTNARWRSSLSGIKHGGTYQARNADKEMIILPMNQITHANSGNFNFNNTIVEPVLERARRPYRQLSLLEDASIIYRLVRAPERLVFNVNTGKLPPARAEEAVYKMMKRYNTQKVYDPTTGGVANGYDPHSMLESYWFAKPEGSGGTDVDSIGGAASFGDLEDLKYFQRKLFISLKIPYNRFDPESAEEKTDGESITYEEYRFAKFIMRIQSRMAQALENSFKTHLQLVGLWDKHKINERMFNIEFVKPTSYELYNQQRILSVKIDNYDSVANHDEFSNEMAQKQFLGWTDSQIEENRKAVEKERLKEAYIERKVDNISQHGYPEDVKPEEELAINAGQF
tara:strand:+ start:662 stop:2365 length:1704 start_codon:yes stop_codon:yes gene_type:complete